VRPASRPSAQDTAAAPSDADRAAVERLARDIAAELARAFPLAWLEQRFSFH